jgi:hypothetical protein
MNTGSDDPPANQQRRHPPTSAHVLHPARAERALLARGVLVLHAALQEIRQRAEPAVRVVRRANSLTRPVGDRAHLVDHEVRPDRLEVGGGERAADDKAAALALTVADDGAGDGARRHAAGVASSSEAGEGKDQALRRNGTTCGPTAEHDIVPFGVHAPPIRSHSDIT